MKKRRFIAAITALMCAGTVFVPNMAVTAAAETQTSAVQTNFPDSIRSDIEAFMNENLHILNNVRPDDPENFMKCFMLRGLIMILDKMFEERHVKLTQKDKDTIQKIFDNDGEIQNGKEKEKDKEKKQIPPVPGKNMHENKYPYYPYP